MAATNYESSVDDFYSDAPVVETQAAPPVEPAAPAAQAPSTPPVQAEKIPAINPGTETPPAPAVADAVDTPDDFWGDLADDEPTPPAAPARQEPSPALRTVAERLGLSEIPESEDDWIQAIENYAALRSTSNDPLSFIDQRLALTGTDFLRAELRERQGELMLFGEQAIEDRLLQLEESGHIDQAEAYYRNMWTQERGKVTRQQAQVEAQQTAQAQQRIQSYESALSQAKDPRGQPYPKRVLDQTRDFLFSGEYEKDLWTSPDFHVQRAIERHPVIGPKIVAMRESMLKKQGASDFIRTELEGQQVSVGSGMGVANNQRSPYAMSEQDYYSDN